ncbi:MAG: permease prefix domain 1-containing protein [Planctomycetota bacterium]
MLAIPRQDRQRVRDELEDHLRSRIDDLLIIGHTEPEALKQAVSELGETADLARQISHAHAPRRKRTYAMHAALIALAGSVTAVGISLSGGGSAPNTVNGVPVVSGVPVVGMAANTDARDEHEARVSLRDTTLEAVIDIATSLADRPVLVHWDVLAQVGIERDHPIDFDVDPLPHHVVHDLLTEYFLNELGDDTLTDFTSEDLFEISTRSHFDLRTMERRTYDLSGFAAAAQSAPMASSRGGQSRGAMTSAAVHSVVEAIQVHVSPSSWQHGGGTLASQTLVGTSLIVTAPERMHEEIASLVEELHEERVAQRDRQAEQAKRLAARVLEEYERVIQKRYSMTEQLKSIEAEHSRIHSQLTMRSDLGEEERDALAKQGAAIESEAERVMFDLSEIEQRAGFLQSRLIEAEYADLM